MFTHCKSEDVNFSKKKQRSSVEGVSFQNFHSFESSLQSMTMWKWGQGWRFWWLEMLSMMICCWWWYRCCWWWYRCWWWWLWRWQWCWLFQLQPGSMHRASGISIAEWPIHISPIPLHSLFTERQKIQRQKQEKTNQNRISKYKNLFI